MKRVWVLTLLPVCMAALTPAAVDSLSLTESAWLAENSVNYILQNPAWSGNRKDSAYADTTVSAASGGIWFSRGAYILGILSGQPTSSEVINSGGAPLGVYNRAQVTGTDQFFSPAFLTGAGGVLDLTATTAPFGNLSRRISDLDDPSRNSLANHQIGFMIAFDNSVSAWGILIQAGYADTISGFDNGVVKETISLRKSQYDVTAGFLTRRKQSVYDFTLRFSVFDVTNRYNGQAPDDFADFRFESAGAYRISGSFRYRIGDEREYYALYNRLEFADISMIGSAISRPAIITSDYDLQDSHSRYGIGWTSGLGRRMQYGKAAGVVFALESRYSWYSLFYDSRVRSAGATSGFTEGYSLTPYSGDLFFWRAPLIIAFDFAMSDSWKLRFGVKQNLVAWPASGFQETGATLSRDNSSFSFTKSGVEDRFTRFESSPTRITFGLGYITNGLAVDWFSGLEWFRSGPNFISGRTLDFSQRVSVSYVFDSGT